MINSQSLFVSLTSLFVLMSCQHLTKTSQTISQNQFRIYATQEIPEKTWMSKARSAALGNARGSTLDTRPQPLFGKNFAEAKSKVVIVDIRSEPDFASDNLSKHKNIKTPILHILWQDLLTKNEADKPETTQRLARQGVFPDSILLLLGDQKTPAKEVQTALKQLGYSQVLIVEGGYENLLQF